MCIFCDLSSNGVTDYSIYNQIASIVSLKDALADVLTSAMDAIAAGDMTEAKRIEAENKPVILGMMCIHYDQFTDPHDPVIDLYLRPERRQEAEGVIAKLIGEVQPPAARAPKRKGRLH